MRITKYMNKLLENLLNEYDTIVVGAGSGLSAAAGFEYGGKTFMDNFKYMYDLYGYTNMYEASFHDFSTQEEKWGFFSKMIYLNRYQEKENKLYKRLFELIKTKDYFIITTNVDHQFQLAGVDKARLFYTQGDYGLFQCQTPCHNKTYDNEKIVKEMLKNLNNHKIPTSLIPRCPICGKPMTMNLRCDDTFVEDEGWHKAKQRYINFINKVKNKKVLYLELGVGNSTPGWIKYPFMNLTNENKNAMYVVVNEEKQFIPKVIEKKTIVINDNINNVLM